MAENTSTLSGGGILTTNNGLQARTFGNATLDTILADLHGYYDFSAGSGQSWRNLATPPRCGDATTDADLTEVATGPDGAGIEMSGTGETVFASGDSVPFGVRSSWSVNVWIAPDDATPAAAQTVLLSRADVNSGTAGFSIYLEQTTGRLRIYSQGAFRATDTIQAFTDNVYSMITYVIDYNSGTPTQRVYLDGAQRITTTAGFARAKNWSFKLSEFASGSTQAMAGEYAAWSVWSKALSQTEIDALYNTGTGRFLS